MKRLLYIVLAILCAEHIAAQDMQILSQTELLGTARYVGMAGAMTAVGGDPSAVKDNPAGLGVYRRMEVSLTLEGKLDRVHQHELPDFVDKNNSFLATQAAFIFSFTDPGKVSGMISNNFMLSYHRLANYNRTYTAGYADDLYSLSDVAALMTNGLPEAALQPAGRWDDPEIGWLSCLAYDTYLIDPNPKEPTQWLSKLYQGDVVNNNFVMRESGNLNQYAIGWGCNLSNRYYIGAALNVLSLYHNQEVKYTELFQDSCGMYNDTYVSHSGVGVNASVGFIAHPLRWLRLGVSFTTPTAMSVTTTSYGSMTGIVSVPDSLGVSRLTKFYSETPQNRHTDRSETLPLRTSVGVAFQLMNYGLLSLQYDYAHRKNLNDNHTFRVGLEGVICNQFFLNAGYAFETSFKKSAPEELAYNTVRTDAYSQFINRSHYVTAGFGFRSSHMMVHAAYRLRMQQFDTFAHELATPYDLRAMTHSIVFTIGFHTKW